MSGEVEGGGSDVVCSTIAYFVGDPRVASLYSTGVLQVVSEGAQAVDSSTSPFSAAAAATATADDAPAYVCIENVPKFITVPEVLGCVPEFRGDILGLRVLGCVATKAQYLLLLALRGAERAELLRARHHGRPFSVLGSEVLYVSFVAPCSAAALLRPAGAAADEAEQCPVCLELTTPLLSCQQPTPPPPPPPPPSSPPLSPAVPAASPTSAVLWTTMCGHTAHFDCILAHDQGAGCPVCRFNPADLGVECNVEGCGETETLWMCLVCGNLGCGRYQAAHAEQHFRESGHTFCLDVNSGSAWDYASDTFVHRLVASQADGVLVSMKKKRRGGGDERDGGAGHPFGGGGVGGMGGGGGGDGYNGYDGGEDEEDLQDAVYESKLHSVSDTYAQLLETQLAAQQLHYSTLAAKEMQERERLLAELAEAEQDEEAAAEAGRVSPTGGGGKQRAKVERQAGEARRQAASLREEAEAEEALHAQVRAGTQKYRARLEAMADVNSKANGALEEKKKTLAGLQANLAELMTQLDG